MFMKNKIIKNKNLIGRTSISFVVSGVLFPIFVLAAITTAVIVTDEAANITLSSATLNGRVIDDGGCNEMVVWFQYGETTSYGQETPFQKDHSFNLQSFSANISNLSLCTLYHFRAKAINNTHKIGRASCRERV